VSNTTTLTPLQATSQCSSSYPMNDDITTCDEELSVFLPRRKHDTENGECRTDDVLSAFNDDDVVDADVNEMSHR